MDLAISHLGLSVLAGSLTTLSPCVFPILPMVLGGAAQGNRYAPLAMGVGMALSFATMGVLIGALGPLIDQDVAVLAHRQALVQRHIATEHPQRSRDVEGGIDRSRR